MHTRDPHQKAGLSFLLLQGSIAIFSPPYCETGWRADLLQVYDDSSISASPWSLASLQTEMRVAKGKKSLTPVQASTAQQDTALADEQWW